MASSEYQSPYLYQGTTVLINKPGLRDQAQLDKFEKVHTTNRLAEIQVSPVKGNFDLKHLQEIHQKVFQDVYPWAGQTRTEDIAKGPKGDRTLFAFKEEIAEKISQVSADLHRANYLRGSDKAAFVEKIATVYADLNSVHPFREGNGRATREFIGQLAAQAGYEFDVTNVNRQQWNEAAKQSYNREALDPIRKIIGEAVTPSRAVSFQNDREGLALAKHPELDGAFTRLAQVRQSFGEGASQNEKDVALIAAKAEIKHVLDQGKLPHVDVSSNSSKQVIEHAAAFRGLVIKEPLNGQSYKGEVVAKSSNHTLIKVGDGEALRYENKTLGRELNVGDRVTLNVGISKQLTHSETISKGMNDARPGQTSSAIQARPADEKDQSKQQEQRAPEQQSVKMAMSIKR